MKHDSPTPKQIETAVMLINGILANDEGMVAAAIYEAKINPHGLADGEREA